MADLYRFSEADLENELPKLRDSDGEPMKPAERIRLMDDCTLTHSWLAGWLPTCLLACLPVYSALQQRQQLNRSAALLAGLANHALHASPDGRLERFEEKWKQTLFNGTWGFWPDLDTTLSVAQSALLISSLPLFVSLVLRKS